MCHREALGSVHKWGQMTICRDVTTPRWPRDEHVMTSNHVMTTWWPRDDYVMTTWRLRYDHVTTTLWPRDDQWPRVDYGMTTYVHDQMSDDENGIHPTDQEAILLYPVRSKFPNMSSNRIRSGLTSVLYHKNTANSKAYCEVFQNGAVRCFSVDVCLVWGNVHPWLCHTGDSPYITLCLSLSPEIKFQYHDM